MAATISLSRSRIDEMFEAATDFDVLFEFYKIAIPDWDNVEKVEHWPSVSEKTWKYICDKFIDLGHKIGGKNVNGGLTWMNWGFSSSEMQDWEIDTSTAKVLYAGGES